MSSQVVTLGEAMLRLSARDRARLQEADALDVHVAGAEANVAVALASLGVSVTWVSALPDVPHAHRIARGLRAAGVDLRFVEWTEDGRVGLFFVEFGAQPRPTSIWYDRTDSAFSRMTTFAAQALDQAQIAVTSGITLALSPSSRELALDFIDRARAQGARICIDVNYRERLCSPDEARAQLQPVLGGADIVTCSRRDAARVFEVEAAAIGDVAVELRDRYAPGADVLAVTDGANGSAAVRGSEVREQPAFATDLVDRVGAGDAHLAGLLWGLLNDESLVDALSYAAALGALKCTVRGDHAVFTADEVRAVARAESVALIR